LDTVVYYKPTNYSKIFVFEANVLYLEYKYKFLRVRKKAIKHRVNELYVYIDFGLKGILQFNSRELYYSDMLAAETSDRLFFFSFIKNKIFLDTA
jgi:hypothetical protein